MCLPVCFYVSTVTNIRKAYRIFPIHFLITYYKNCFSQVYAFSDLFIDCYYSKYLLCLCCSIHSVIIKNVNSCSGVILLVIV